MIALGTIILGAGSATGNPVIDLLIQGGSSAVLGGVIVAFLRGDLASGRELKRVIAERDRAIELVYQLAGTTQSALSVAEKHKDGK